MSGRFLFVVEDAFPLGANLQLSPLVSRLHERKSELHVAILAGRAHKRRPKLDWPANFHSLPPTTRPNQVHLLAQLIAKLNPDVVHAWNCTAQLPTIAAAGGRKVMSTSLEHHGAANWFNRAYGKLRMENRLNSISHCTIIDQEPSHSNPTIIRNSGVDLKCDRQPARQRLIEIAERTCPDELLARDEAILVGTVARLQPAWQLKDLIWATDLLCCVRNDIHLFVFGSGSQRKRLQKFARQTASAQHVHFVSTREAELQDLAGLDIFWNAQTSAPDQPALLTAMRIGIPIISVLAEETRDAVVPLTTALATNPGARDEFARWTKFLIEQPRSRDQLVEQARAHVEANFSLGRSLTGYLDWYAQSAGPAQAGQI